jgi:redox-sensitive bicupin YhaK (pirin superfamily)
VEVEIGAGSLEVIYPGLAQRMSAGTGIWHSEMNPSGEDVHFVQMWVLPDTERVDPSYEQLDISGELSAAGAPALAADAATGADVLVWETG